MANSTSGYAPINGLKMYYEIHGTGDIPLVLIHGGGSTIESSFGRLIPLLEDHFKVFAVELQAHGRTSDRDAPESFSQDADDVAALLRYLQVPQANILGFSNGGSTTLQIAIRHPELVNKIIVVAGCYRRDGLVSGMFEGLKQATIDNMPAPLKDSFLNVNKDQAQLHSMFQKDRQRMLEFKDWPDEDIKSIKAATMLMVADHDVVTPEHTLQLSRLIPDARLVILPGTHGSFIGELCASEDGSEMPAVTVALIKEFLQ